MAILAGSIAASGSGAFAAPAQGLGEIAAANGFVFGAAAGPVIYNDAPYRDLYTAHTQIVTTDVAMKMGSIAGQPGPKRFDAGDRLLKFCFDSKLPMPGSR